MGGLWTSFDEDYRSISQELRVATDFDGPVNVIVGGLYEDADLTNLVANMQLDRPADPVTGTRLVSTNSVTNKGETLSAFGQLTVDLTENLELAGGVRWTREKKSTSMVNDYVHPTANAVNPLNRRAQGLVLNSLYNDSNWSPEATLAYHPTRFFAAAFIRSQGGSASTAIGSVPEDAKSRNCSQPTRRISLCR